MGSAIMRWGRSGQTSLFFGGPVIFDALLDAWHVAWRMGDPVTFSSYLRSGTDIDTRLLATVAAYVLPPYEPMGTLWNKVYLRLCESDQMDDPDRLASARTSERLSDSVRPCLSGREAPARNKMAVAKIGGSRSQCDGGAQIRGCRHLRGRSCYGTSPTALRQSISSVVTSTIRTRISWRASSSRHDWASFDGFPLVLWSRSKRGILQM